MGGSREASPDWLRAFQAPTRSITTLSSDSELSGDKSPVLVSLEQIEAIMNDFIQLKPQSNVYDAETMVEGTLEGFTFDSDEEPEKMTKEAKGDQNEGAEEKTNKKAKGKVEKKSVKSATTKKKGKDVGAKQPKKRKPQAPKKGKAKK